VPQLERDITVFSNEIVAKEEQMATIKEEKKQSSKLVDELQAMAASCRTYEGALKWKADKENKEMERLQVINYD